MSASVRASPYATHLREVAGTKHKMRLVRAIPFRVVICLLQSLSQTHKAFTSQQIRRAMLRFLLLLLLSPVGIAPDLRKGFTTCNGRTPKGRRHDQRMFFSTNSSRGTHLDRGPGKMLKPGDHRKMVIERQTKGPGCLGRKAAKVNFQGK